MSGRRSLRWFSYVVRVHTNWPRIPRSSSWMDWVGTGYHLVCAVGCRYYRGRSRLYPLVQVRGGKPFVL